MVLVTPPRPRAVVSRYSNDAVGFARSVLGLDPWVIPVAILRALNWTGLAMTHHHFGSKRLKLNFYIVIAVSGMNRCHDSTQFPNSEGRDPPLRTVWCENSDNVTHSYAGILKEVSVAISVLVDLLVATGFMPAIG